jgi:adenylate kinase
MAAELNLILLGPPGAGKGTQAGRLSDDFPIGCFATGTILRQAVEERTEMGTAAKRYMDDGALVPDDVVIGIIRERLDTQEAADGFLLDGFPRNVAQAEALDELLDGLGRRLTAALLIEVPDDEIVRRLSGRRQCKEGHTYHVDLDPPKHPDRCDVDGLPLFQRDDDRPEVIRKRLETYHDKTAPLVEYYEERGLLRRFDGTRSPTEVHDHLRATVATLRLEDEL